MNKLALLINLRENRLYKYFSGVATREDTIGPEEANNVIHLILDFAYNKGVINTSFWNKMVTRFFSEPHEDHSRWCEDIIVRLGDIINKYPDKFIFSEIRDEFIKEMALNGVK